MLVNLRPTIENLGHITRFIVKSKVMRVDLEKVEFREIGRK